MARGDGRGVLQPGDLDTLIRIEVAYPVADTVYGTEDIVEWTLAHAVWAQVRDVLPGRGEQAAEGIVVSRRPARIRTWWIDGITSAMRIVIDTHDENGELVSTRTLQLISEPAMIGRREGMELMAEEYSTAGAPVEVI